ncbi:MAG: HlyD family efflux transporter periplasmic adaptor subunit [Christensenellales bacterium]
MARKRVKFSSRFYIIIFVFVALIALALFLLLSSKGEMRIEAGTLEYTSIMKTVIIRNEQVTNAENWGKITYIASEGEQVNEGDAIAQVYKAGYNERMLQDLRAVQKDISDYIEQTLLKDVINQDLTALEEGIETLMQSISLVVRGEEEGDIFSLEQDLIVKMQGRQDLLRTLVQNDETLEDLLEKESSYQDKISTWKTDITAGQAGMVSFYFDGCEAFLTPENINSLTRDDVLNLLNGTYKKKKTGTNAGVSTPLYRVVNNFDWYCLFLVNEIGSDEFKEGETYNITFEGFYTQPYEATVAAKKDLDLSTLFVMHITQDIGSLLGTRQATANISKAFSGYVVPLQAISKNKNGVDGIRVMEGNEIVFVPINLIYSDGENAVVSAADDTQLSPNEMLY